MPKRITLALVVAILLTWSQPRLQAISFLEAYATAASAALLHHTYLYVMCKWWGNPGDNYCRRFENYDVRAHQFAIHRF